MTKKKTGSTTKKTTTRLSKASAERETVERGKAAVKAVMRKLEATAQKFSGRESETPAPEPAPAPSPATEGVVTPSAGLGSMAGSPKAPAAGRHQIDSASAAGSPTADELQHVDLTPYREVVTTVAGFLWRLRGGDDLANWVAAERIVARAILESRS